MGCHALLEGIFLTQVSSPCLLSLLHCRQILYRWATGEAHSSPVGPFKTKWNSGKASAHPEHPGFDLCRATKWIASPALWLLLWSPGESQLTMRSVSRYLTIRRLPSNLASWPTAFGHLSQLVSDDNSKPTQTCKGIWLLALHSLKCSSFPKQVMQMNMYDLCVCILYVCVWMFVWVCVWMCVHICIPLHLFSLNLIPLHCFQWEEKDHSATLYLVGNSPNFLTLSFKSG